MSLIPYKYNVTNNSNILIIPAFPGAYIYNRGIDSSPTALPIPIYMSNPVAGNEFSVMNDADYMLLVLPGFKVEIYADVSFGTFKYSVDNTAGTDLRFYANKTGSYTGSSYKLYYGIQEIAQNTKTATPSISYGNAVLTTGVVYEGNSYTLYSYTTTTGTSTFQYNDSGQKTNSISALILLVAGGGAGGVDTPNNMGGGGGGGGVAYGSMTFARDVSYTCTVGNGGQSYDSAINATGKDSSITNPSSQSITVKGGGCGGAGISGRGFAGGNGGSGGGACHNKGGGTAISATIANNNTIGATVTFWGNNGGTFSGSASSNVAGGGGGAGAAGGSPSDNVTSGNGGAGTPWPVNGATYGGGGGGGQQSNGATRRLGGSGGGGHGAWANTSGSALTATSGDNGLGGGGGGTTPNTNTTIGKGGSGIIIIAVKTSDLNAYTYI
jgi:hypothetical protein